MEQQEWQPQFGDHVHHRDKGDGIIDKVDLNGDIPYRIKLINGNHWWCFASTLRLISRAENPTDTWTPKWGEEVEAMCYTGIKKVAYYIGNNPDPRTKDKYPHICISSQSLACEVGAYQHIRPIPKPKTLREEVLEWAKENGCSLTCDSKIKLRIILDRHEKGDSNEFV